MHIETSNQRLLTLAAFLEQLPEDKFDYNRWVGDDWQGDESLSCGTTACAMGWATTIPEFRKLGLRLGGSVSDYSRSRPIIVIGNKLIADGMDAAEFIFGLDYEHSRYLFLPNYELDDDHESPPNQASAREVAAHIRNFVAERTL